MPRKKRTESPVGIYHWINRGYLKQNIFHSRSDFEVFLSLVSEYKDAHGVVIYHYCLLNNHVHFLIQAPTVSELSVFSHFVKRRYAYYFSKTYHHAGPTFEKRFVAIPIDGESYLLECARYIERNPLRAGLAKHPADYEFSSASYYLNRKQSLFLTLSPAFLGLSDDPYERTKAYEDYIAQVRPQEEYASKALPAI